MSIQPSVRIMFLFRRCRRPMPLHSESKENQRKRSKDCKMHNSARSRDNLRSPLNTKCNTGLFAASAHILNNPPRKQYFAWQEVKKTLSPKKKFYFSNWEWSAADLPLFVWIFKATKLVFVPTHPHRWSKSQAPFPSSNSSKYKLKTDLSMSIRFPISRRYTNAKQFVVSCRQKAKRGGGPIHLIWHNMF